MRNLSILCAAVAAGATLAACSGSLGSGATPPVTAPAAAVPAGGAVPQSSAMSAAGAAAAAATDAHRAASLGGSTPIPLPTAAGYGGTILLTEAAAAGASPLPSGSPTPDASPSAAPSASPSASASPTPSGPTAKPSAAPRVRRSAAETVLLTLHALPSSAPVRTGDTSDGAVVPMVSLELVPQTAVTLPGLDAVSFVIPSTQIVADRHFALALFDTDQKQPHGSMLSHKKSPVAESASALDSTISAGSLIFSDASAPISLVAKRHYVVVLYADTVTPASVPASAPPGVAASGAPAVSASGSPAPGSSAQPSVTTPAAASSGPTPYVSYPNSGALQAATPMAGHF